MKIDRPVLVDAGPLIAVFSDDDEHHARCVSEIRRLKLPLVSCWAVIAEAAWRLQARPDRAQDLLRMIATGGIVLPQLDERTATPEIAAIMKRYASIRAQLADATLLYLADQLKTDVIFTTDVRDFSIYRLKGNRSVRVIPESS